jgi:hypothetical protein
MPLMDERLQRVGREATLVELKATVPALSIQLFLDIRRYATDFRGSDRPSENCHNGTSKEMRSVDAGPIS